MSDGVSEDPTNIHDDDGQLSDGAPPPRGTRFFTLAVMALTVLGEVTSTRGLDGATTARLGADDTSA